MNNNRKELQISFGNPNLVYKCKFPWPDNIYVQGRDDILYPWERNQNQFSFEIFIGSDYYFIERGETQYDAEVNAWEAFQNILKCNHKKYETNDNLPHNSAVCNWCNVLITNITKDKNNKEFYYDC